MIAKMALQDGSVAPEERQTLADMGGGLTEGELQELVEEARATPLDSLLTGIEKYEDRFLIALRAYHMAHSDLRLDIAEEMSFELLITRFGITEEDRRLIEQVQDGLTSEGSSALVPRLVEIHKNSSFFEGGGWS